jgi:hypothetical protein
MPGELGANPMTFEEFKATRHVVPNLAAAHPECFGYEGRPGFLYLGTCLFIEIAGPLWPAKAREQGGFYLILNNDEYISDNLDELEKKLFDWAQSEGY